MKKRVVGFMLVVVLCMTCLTGPIMAEGEMQPIAGLDETIRQAQDSLGYKIRGAIIAFAESDYPVQAIQFVSYVSPEYNSRYPFNSMFDSELRFELLGFEANVPNYVACYDVLENKWYFVYMFDENLSFDGITILAYLKEIDYEFELVNYDYPEMKTVNVTCQWQDNSQPTQLFENYVLTMDDFNNHFNLSHGIPHGYNVVVESTDDRIVVNRDTGWLHIPNVAEDIDVVVTLVPEPTEVELTNLLQAPDYSDLSEWYVSPDNATMAASGDTLTLTIDSTEDLYYTTVRQDLNLDITHQYYVRAGMSFDRDSFPGAASFFTVLNLGNNQLWNERYTTTGWVDASAVGSPSHNGNNRFQQLFRVSPTGYHLGGVMHSREPMVIDLTEAFGPGNEPSVEWCDANIPYFSGTTTITL